MTNRIIKTSLTITGFIGVAASATACTMLYAIPWAEQPMWARVLSGAMPIAIACFLWLFLRGGRR